MVGGRRGHADVVGLPSTAGDERVAALGEGVGAEVLELAHLVAAAAEAGEVVPLHPQAAGGQPELGAEAVHRLHRRGRHRRQRHEPIEHAD